MMHHEELSVSLFKLHAIPEAETTHLPLLMIKFYRMRLFIKSPRTSCFLYEIESSLMNASHVVKGGDLSVVGSTASTHCQKLGTRWRLRVRTKATMAANSYKKMYGDNETFSNISIMSSRVFGARLETCQVLCNLRIWVKNS